MSKKLFCRFLPKINAHNCHYFVTGVGIYSLKIFLKVQGIALLNFTISGTSRANLETVSNFTKILIVVKGDKIVHGFLKTDTV